MGSWHIAVNLLLPLPLLVLLLLSIPLPTFLSKTGIRGFALKIVDAVIFIKIYGGVTVYALATAISTGLFLITAHEVYHANHKQRSAIHVTEKEQFKCIRWRLERNFWISLLSLILWVVLYRFRTLIKEIEEERLVNRSLQEAAEEKETKKTK
jgi:Bap31/Bap29 transmembrane region